MADRAMNLPYLRCSIRAAAAAAVAWWMSETSDKLKLTN